MIPGCIIYRQRGTKWYPGENCDLGRDHTIYATQAGYVRYYLDPEKHPDRRFIGVCFEKDGKLPTPRNAPTRRKLNLVAVPRVSAFESDHDGGDGGSTVDDPNRGLKMRPGYMFREMNWEIGRAPDRAGIVVPKFNRKNRWLAWRKRQARSARAAEAKSIRSQRKSSKKKGGR